MSARAEVVFNNSKRVSAAVQRELEATIAQAALAVEAEAKRRAPVDTGLLRNSINATMPKPTTGIVSAHAEYAPHVEFGTIRTRPQPFLLPAFHAVLPRLRAKLRNIGGTLR